jgi:hypothetical protein
MYDVNQNPNTYLANKEDEAREFDAEVYVRLGFIKKVYGILSIMLSVSTIFICMSTIPKVHEKFESGNNVNSAYYVLLGISCFVTFATMIPLFCCKSVSKSVPINYILLALFTLAQSYILFFVSACYAPEIVVTAIVLTAAVTIGLTVYAMTTKTDFTWCGGILFAFLFLFIAFLVLLWIFGTDKLTYKILCLVGVLLYSLYLIYDTQLTMGKGACKYEIDEYVWAAVNLYVDIIEIFLYILRLLGNSNQS